MSLHEVYIGPNHVYCKQTWKKDRAAPFAALCLEKPFNRSAEWRRGAGVSQRVSMYINDPLPSVATIKKAIKHAETAGRFLFGATALAAHETLVPSGAEQW